MTIFDKIRRWSAHRQLRSQRVICVLGMHRSGTSALIGSLEQAGVNLGDVSRKNPYNRKGNREHPKFMELHDDILHSNGASWDRPPTNVAWNERQRAQRDKLILERGACSCWGFKDPRTLLLLEGWLEAIPHLEFIGTVRHPLSVADSLARRNRLEVKESLELWSVYNQRLLEYHRARHFPLLNFDAPAAEYRRKLLESLHRLRLQPVAHSLNFFEDDLRTSSMSAQTPMPASVAALYASLLEATL